MADDARLAGFLLSLEVWGCSVHGHEKVAFRVCEDRESRPNWDFEMWDRTEFGMRNERVNGKPVPLWWALRGFRDPKWEACYGAA